MRYIYKPEGDTPKLHWGRTLEEAREWVESNVGKCKLFIPFHKDPTLGSDILKEVILLSGENIASLPSHITTITDLFKFIEMDFDEEPVEIFVAYDETEVSKEIPASVLETKKQKKERRKKERGRWRRYRQQQEAA